MIRRPSSSRCWGTRWPHGRLWHVRNWRCDRILPQRVTRPSGSPRRGIPGRPSNRGVHHRSERDDGVSLGRRSIRIKLPMLARELAERHVSVLIAGGGDVSALATKAATSTIPGSFCGQRRSGPVRTRFRAQPARRKHYRCDAVYLEIGVKNFSTSGAELVPRARLIGVFINPNNAASPVDEDKLKNAAGLMGVS